MSTVAVMETALRYRWVILGLALLSQSSSALAGQSAGPLAPLIQADLGISKAQVGLLASASFAGALCLQLAAGSLTDRVGVRVVMAGGQIVAGLLLMTILGTSSFVQACAVMFAAGLARGSVFPSATKAIVEWFPPGIRATAMGLKQTGMPVAGIVTAATLPALGLALGWRAAIAAAGLFIMSAGIGAAFFYRDPRHPGAVVTRIVGMRAGLRDVLRNRGIWTLGSVAMLFGASQQAMLIYLVLYFKDVVLAPVVPDEAARLVVAGGYLALCQAGGVIGRISWGAASDRIFHGRRVVVMALTGALGAALLLSMSLLEPGTPAWLLTPVVFCAGFSAIGWNGVFQTVVAETAGRKYAATASGLAGTLIETGTMAGPPLFGLVVDVSGSYRPAWLLIVVLYTVGTLVAARIAQGERRGGQ